MRRRLGSVLVLLILAGSASVACSDSSQPKDQRPGGTPSGGPAGDSDEQSSGRPAITATWPASPPARICGDPKILTGPATPPAGAVVVPAGDNSSWTNPWNTPTFAKAGTTYWFAPGVHTLGEGEFDQIGPEDDTTYIGAPGAVIDGQHKNRLAFGGEPSNVTITYLTIRNFGTGQDNNDEGVVNHDRGDNWTVSHNTLIDNDGAAVMLGSGSVTTYNCLKDNGQYGFSGLPRQDRSSAKGVLLDHNEIVGNNTDDWEKLREGCGCTGGGKFWEVSGAVVTNNYVHDNKGAGLWADYNNRDFLFENNWIEANEAVAIMYETSYNFMIRNNVMIRNGLVEGKKYFGGVGDSFPMPAVYISESGGDVRAGDRFAVSEIHHNYLRDNWDGVALWENSDRFCRPAEEDSDVTAGCPYFARVYGERNKTQNIMIHDNEFHFDKADTGVKGAAGCTNTYCGRNSVFSNYGINKTYRGDVIARAITFKQNNKWYANRYFGAWHFQPFDVGTDKTFHQWQASPYSQDAGSTQLG